MKQERVRDRMTTPVVTISPQTNLVNAYSLMKERHIRRLPVIEEGRLVGIVTRGDLRAALAAHAEDLDVFRIAFHLDQLAVSQAMTREVITITPQATLAEAARLMIEHEIGGLPVVEGDQLVGILTEADLFRSVMQRAAAVPNPK